MTDIVDIAISASASAVADNILEQGYFKNKSDVLSFAAAYMIKNHFDAFDPSTYALSDTNGSNYSYSTFDADGKWSSLVRALYPGVETPNMYLRALMNQGLLLLGQRMIDDPSYSLLDEIE